MSKKKVKADFSNYSNEELFEYFKEAIFVGDFDAAENSIRELLKRIDAGEISSDEEKILYWKGMGFLCEMTNREDEAREYFLKVLDLKPDDAESLEHIRKLSGLETESDQETKDQE